MEGFDSLLDVLAGKSAQKAVYQRDLRRAHYLCHFLLVQLLVRRDGQHLLQDAERIAEGALAHHRYQLGACGRESRALFIRDGECEFFKRLVRGTLKIEYLAARLYGVGHPLKLCSAQHENCVRGRLLESF